MSVGKSERLSQCAERFQNMLSDTPLFEKFGQPEKKIRIYQCQGIVEQRDSDNESDWNI